MVISATCMTWRIIESRPWFRRACARLHDLLAGGIRLSNLRRASFVGNPSCSVLRRIRWNDIYPELRSKNQLRQSLLSNDVKEQLHGYDPLEQFREHYRRADTEDTLSRLQYLDIKTYLTDDICVKLDRASMAVSLEARCPLLDDRLMELAARIPSHLKVRNGSGKYILKRANEPMFCPKFLERPKQGFGVPIAEWFRNELAGVGARIDVRIR